MNNRDYDLSWYKLHLKQKDKVLLDTVKDREIIERAQSRLPGMLKNG